MDGAAAVGGGRAALRRRLAHLYPDQDDARRVVGDAKLPVGRIDFGGSPETRWQRVLDEANKHADGVERVLAAVKEEYPDAFEDLPSVAQAAARAKAPPLPSFPTAVAPPEREPADFFISYAGRDEGWAEWIAWTLNAEGYRCRFQKWDFRPGGDFIADMQDAAAHSERTLGVLSPDLLASDYAMMEIRAALATDPDGAKRKLLLVRVRDCKPEGLLAARAYTDVVGITSEEAARVVLLGALKVDRAKPSGPVAFPGGGSGDRPAFPRETSALAARATVIAIDEELGAHAAAVAERLARIAGIGAVERIDAARAGAATTPPPDGPVIALLGARTGGTTVMAAAMERRPPPLLLKVAAFDPALLRPDEMAEAMRLYSSASGAPTFATLEEAAERAAEQVAGWLRERSRTPEGAAPVLEDWEREYLSHRLPRWERGNHGPLISLAADRPLHLARLYVPLNATTEVVFLDLDGRPMRLPRDKTEQEKGSERHPFQGDHAGRLLERTRAVAT
jgi:hypothetical protein